MSLRNSYNMPFRQLTGYTGRLVETEFIPACQAFAHADQTGYRPYGNAMTIARHAQPDGWDPTEPDGRAGDLHAMVFDLLGAPASDVHLYTARTSALDRFHGVDCWLEYGGRPVTVDVTVNPHKAEGYKADVVLLYNGEAGLEQAAGEIAGRFRLLHGRTELPQDRWPRYQASSPSYDFKRRNGSGLVVPAH